jgi:hypothetical protein
MAPRTRSLSQLRSGSSQLALLSSLVAAVAARCTSQASTSGTLTRSDRGPVQVTSIGTRSAPPAEVAPKYRAQLTSAGASA